MISFNDCLRMSLHVPMRLMCLLPWYTAASILKLFAFKKPCASMCPCVTIWPLVYFNGDYFQWLVRHVSVSAHVHSCVHWLDTQLLLYLCYLPWKSHVSVCDHASSCEYYYNNCAWSFFHSKIHGLKKICLYVSMCTCVPIFWYTAAAFVTFLPLKCHVSLCANVLPCEH